MHDELDIRIEDDGKTITITSGSFAGTKHKNADEFVKWLHNLCGGKAEVKSTKQSLGQSVNQGQQQQHKH